MNVPENDMDREIFAGFIEESMDSLAEAESAIVELEADPGNTDLMAAIFRAAHSLKGNSAFFGLMNVKTLAHRMEDLLDAVRKGLIAGSGRVVDALLPGLDLLRQMLEDVRADRPELSEPSVLDAVLKGLDQALKGEAAPLSLVSVRRSIQTARDRLPDALKSLLDEALRLTDTADVSGGELRECAEEAKPRGGQGVLATLLEAPFDDVASDTQLKEIERALGPTSAPDSDSETLALMTEAREIFDTFRNSPVGLDNTAREMLLDIAMKLPQPDTAAVETAREPQPAAETREHSNAAKTLRIAESSLDAFLDHVGELIGIEEMLRYCLRQTGGTGPYRELKQVVEQFCKVSADLRSGIMETRKVQAKALLGKAPRLVRDVAAQSGKQIRVHCTGEAMRIDKNYAELLDAPLVHMVRNAADHGIERPEEREQSGKPAEGAIHIELTEKENDLRLIIADDGRGLDRDALTAKAVEMGLASAGRPLTEDDIIRLLFTSGVSTAAEVTDISGRGVGMDVVRQAIDAAGGRITVDSTPGRGSVFTIKLPKNVSTKIIDGYLVRGRDGSIYVLPLKAVLEAFVVARTGTTTVKGKGRVVNRRDGLHPVLDLDAAVRDAGAACAAEHAPSSEATLVLLHIGGRTVALSVAEIVGVQKVVVKPIDGLASKNGLIEGAAVMGDGGVALILGDHGLAGLLADTGPGVTSSLQHVEKEATP